MKRILLLVLSLALVALPLAACAPEPAPPAPPAEETPPVEAAPLPAPAPTPGEPEAPIDIPDEQINLIVWESIDGPDEFIRQAGAAFTALNPNVTVEFVHVELGDTVTRMMLDGPAGIGADVFVAPHDRMGDLVAAELVQPVVNAVNVANSVLGATAMAATFEGVMFGYPVAAETYGLFYNRALIDTPPTTFAEVVEFAREFNDPAAGRWGFYINVTSAYYGIIFMTSDDNLLFGPDGTDGQSPNLNTPQSIESMTFFQSLREILDMPADDITDGMGDAGFMAGDIAMHVTGPWNIQNFIDAGIDFGIAPLPSLPGETSPATSFSGTRCMFVSNFTMHPEAAHAFAEFLTTPEMQQLRFDITGAIPSVDIPLDSPHLPGLLQQLDYAFPMPSIPGMGLFWEHTSGALRNIWNGADVQEELDLLNAVIIAG